MFAAANAWGEDKECVGKMFTVVGRILSQLVPSRDSELSPDPWELVINIRLPKNLAVPLISSRPEPRESTTITRVFPFPVAKNPGFRRAVSRWIVGHHAYFVTFEMAITAAGRALDALAVGDSDSTLLWLARTAQLKRTIICLNKMTANMPGAAYRKHVRTTEKAFNTAFSGASLRELYVYKSLVQRIDEKIAAMESGVEKGRLLKAKGELEATEKAWWIHHQEIRTHLVAATAPSLAREHFQKSSDVKQKYPRYQDYLEHLSKSEAEFDDHDRFFGVLRDDNFSFEQFVQTFWHAMHRLDNLPPEDAIEISPSFTLSSGAEGF